MNLSYERIHEQDTGIMLDLWNRNIGALFPLDEQLLRQNVFGLGTARPTELTGAYASDTKELIGMIAYQQQTAPMGLVPSDPTVGTIRFLIVDFRYRRQGIGTRLLNDAENHLRSSGVQSLQLGGELRHFFPGIPSICQAARDFFRKHGYEEGGAAYDLIGDLSRTNLHEAIKPKWRTDYERYVVTEMQQEDEEEVMAFFKRNFPDRWYEEMSAFLTNVAQHEHVAILKEKGGSRVIGFSRIHDKTSRFIGSSIYWRGQLGDDFGGLGPIGLDGEYRKHGLGLFLLYKSLEMLQQRNVKYCIIDWTVLLDFYGFFNFIPWKEYVLSSKMLTAAREGEHCE
ncbi:GNAT family N-acetyltransferase [Gorillibacterium massiliense]|uniref:GNAT family N-acetyltransferase n=1 Tax=Gorillibacterium massiliense TaxID=1280390 RepID=UPI0004B53A0E|nr:GNAT family N-acetyltransferase [Gorillibacterium massiliense]